MRDMFSLNPFVAFIYFASVFSFTMFLQNPIFAFIAVFGGMTFFIIVKQTAKTFGSFGFMMGLFLVVVLTNPLFSHNGVTVLFFLNNNPVTVEAIIYGVYLGLMLVAVLIWFRCFNLVITDDKWLYLTAKISPKISLLLSSALRFVPLLKEQSKKIKNAQKAMGLYSSESWFDKLKSVLRVYSALIGWSLEKAVDTGASMKARGYGLKGRTNYSLYKFNKFDLLMLCVILCLDSAVIALIEISEMSFSFYPFIEVSRFGVYQISAVVLFAVMCFLPFILSVKEGVKWKYLKSKI